MDSIDITNLKIEKANAILRYRRLQTITTLFRFMELFFVLTAISRFFTLFPAVTFNLSTNFFRGIILRLISPHFVFVLGNVIVLILFLNSGKFSTQTGEKSSADLYDEYVREKNQKIRREENEYQKKKQNIKGDSEIIATKTNSSYRERKISRSHSENLIHCEKPPRRELRRSVTTEKCRRTLNDDEKTTPAVKDDMSSEEFRKAVEDFIARQQRILREEEFSAI